jgi:TRAP-type C4-dicarboxylate transport system permease small subunit
VLFDSLDAVLPPLVRRIQQAAVDLFCAAALFGLAWLMWDKAGQMAQYGDVTAQLKMPLGPFVYVMSVLCAATALVHAMLLVQPAAHQHAGVDDHAGAT